MSAKSILIAGVALTLLASTVPAHAQAAPPTSPPPAPGNNIDDRVRQQLRVPTQSEREEAILTGDSDIVLTRRTRLFTISGSLDFTATSNAFLAPASPVADGLGQAQINLGLGTRIGGKVDVFASVGMVGVRYFDNTALNYNAVTASIGARANFGRLLISASYQPTIVLSGDFSSRQLTSHRLLISASLPFRLRGVTFEPAIGGERVLADPADYNAWSGHAGLTISAPISRKVPIIAYASGQYQRRSFDSYFTGLVGTDRRDNNWSASVGLVWRPNRWSEVRASYYFQRNTSTSDVNAYLAHSGTLGLSASLRF